MHVQNGLKMAQNAKNGIFGVATLATLKFSNLALYIQLSMLYNLLLEFFENLLPSRRR